MNTVKKAVRKTKIAFKKGLGMNTSADFFQTDHYLRHNRRRQEHLATLGIDLSGSTVLEVGAGIGDHTSFFIDRGCKVVSSDAREDNISLLRARYPGMMVMKLDLDSPPAESSEKFDIVYCYGLLYHLERPAGAIEFMARACKKVLLLETCVSFGERAEVNLCAEHASDPTQSFTGRGCRPTRPWVYAELKKHFEHVYMPVTQPNHEEFPIDWTGPSREAKLSRAVFVASREPLAGSVLTEGVPMKQRRAP